MFFFPTANPASGWLPQGLEADLWQELQAYEEANKMPYITSVERIGVQKGLEQGIQQGVQQGIQQGVQQGIQQGVQQGIQQGVQRGLMAERQLLLRQIQRRFGEAVAQQCQPLLERITDPAVLEEIGELLLDSGSDALLQLVRAHAE